MDTNSSMDGYLNYLKGRIRKLEERGSFTECKNAQAEFNRALDYARRNGQTVGFIQAAKEDSE